MPVGGSASEWTEGLRILLPGPALFCKCIPHCCVCTTVICFLVRAAPNLLFDLCRVNEGPLGPQKESEAPPLNVLCEAEEEWITAHRAGGVGVVVS